MAGLSVLLAALVAAAWLHWRHRSARDRGAATATDLAECLLALSLELRAGVLPVRALVATCAGVDHEALRQAVTRVRCAQDPAPALLASADPALRALGSLWRLSADTGAPLAEACAALAQGCRARAEADRALRAALAGPRASALLLAGLPLLGLALGQAMGADPLGVLFGGVPGAGLLAAGLALAALGTAWTSRLARTAGRAL